MFSLASSALKGRGYIGVSNKHIRPLSVSRMKPKVNVELFQLTEFKLPNHHLFLKYNATAEKSKTSIKENVVIW